jgi:anti-anti-sigma factor
MAGSSPAAPAIYSFRLNHLEEIADCCFLLNAGVCPLGRVNAFLAIDLPVQRAYRAVEGEKTVQRGLPSKQRLLLAFPTTRSPPMAANPVSPTPELQIDTEKTATETTLHCAGRITSSTSNLLQSTVKKSFPENKTIVLDLSKVTHVDSLGLGALVGVWISARKQGCELRFVSLSERVKELFRLTALDKLFAASRFPDTPSF